MPIKRIPLLVTFLLASAAYGDELILDDGSRLVGTLLQSGEDAYVISTQFAGEVSVDPAHVIGIRTESRRTVWLRSGDQIVGRLTLEEGQQRIVDTAFGETSLDITAIQGVWAPGEPNPFRTEAQEEEIAELEAQHEQELAAARKETEQLQLELTRRPVEPADLWSGRVELGIDGQTGNSERFRLQGRTEARRETQYERLLLYMRGQRAEQEGERSANELLGGARIEVDISERWFAFAKTELEYDEFENLDLRSTTVVGAGYFFIREEGHELKGRAGVGYQFEAFRDGGNEDDIIIELGYDYLIDLREWLRLTHSLSYFPVVDAPFDEFRINAETAAEIPIGPSETWKLRMGVRNEYDNDPQPGVEELDTSYFLNLAYDWK